MRFSIDRDHVVSDMSADETTLVHVDTTYYYGLNATGTFIWNFLLERDATLDEIVRAVSAEYKVEPSVIRQDIQQLLQELEQEGLVHER